MSSSRRVIDLEHLQPMALGCSVLGAGGGGDTYATMLACRHAIERFGPVELADLDDLPDEALVMPCGYIGAPVVSLEKVGSGEEGAWLRDGLERLRGAPVAALLASEIGGGNGMQPISWAARIGLPVADADGMGRAFPEVPQMTMEIAGIDPNPSVLTDERGNHLTINAVDGAWMERIARALSVQFGGSAASTEYTMTAAQARTSTVRGSVTLAIRIGRALQEADDPLAALQREIGASVLIRGKITDVERRVTGGFVRGRAEVEGLGGDRGRSVALEIQNENLVALEGTRLLATVPDIITVLDSETGEAIHTELLRYGQRVAVIAFPCDPVWRTPGGLALAGPRAFGYDVDYVPVEELAA
jgi:uncharacterized protein